MHSIIPFWSRRLRAWWTACCCPWGEAGWPAGAAPWAAGTACSGQTSCRDLQNPRAILTNIYLHGSWRQLFQKNVGNFNFYTSWLTEVFHNSLTSVTLSASVIVLDVFYVFMRIIERLGLTFMFKVHICSTSIQMWLLSSNAFLRSDKSYEMS